MRQSKIFTKTRKEALSDEVSKNAQLLIRAGYIHKEMAGVYDYLPLGLRVLNKINNIIRQEMNKIGGEEMFLSTLQKKEVWEKTGRWDDKKVDNWFKTKIINGTEVGLSFTHEEPLTNLMKEHLRSFRDLPIFPYQIQTKFRNEKRAKSGILRGREFLMKDMYSFCKDEKEHQDFYDKSKTAYLNIFKGVGIGEKTYMTFASGGVFSKYSHEFQTITSAGEDTIHICDKCKIAVNEEVIKDQKNCPECSGDLTRTEKAIEVGNIFSLGTRFSEALELKYTDESGDEQFVVMGSYGIGPGRLMGTVVEVLADEKGLIWPEEIAPFKYHLISVGDSDKVKDASNSLYEKMNKKGIEVLYDDRDIGAGGKFADSDLIGIPNRIVISEKTLADGKIELKRRSEEKVEMVDEESILN